MRRLCVVVDGLVSAAKVCDCVISAWCWQVCDIACFSLDGSFLYWLSTFREKIKKIYPLEVWIFGRMHHRIPFLLALRASVRRFQMPLKEARKGVLLLQSLWNDGRLQRKIFNGVGKLYVCLQLNCWAIFWGYLWRHISYHGNAQGPQQCPLNCSFCKFSEKLIGWPIIFISLLESSLNSLFFQHGKKLGDICFRFFFSSPAPRKTTRKSQKNSKIFSVSLNFAEFKVTFSRCTVGFKKCSYPSI